MRTVIFYDSSKEIELHSTSSLLFALSNRIAFVEKQQFYLWD